MISALCHPNVNSLDAGFIDIVNAIIDIANPIMSAAKWAVSVKMAIELAKYPPMHWAIMKKKVTVDANFNFKMDFLYAFKSFSLDDLLCSGYKDTFESENYWDTCEGDENFLKWSSFSIF